MAKTTNEFGVISEKVGNTFKNDYSQQTPEQNAAMFKSYENDDPTPAASTTQMASVVNAALGKQTPKTWEEFTAGKDLDSLTDAQWAKQYDNYYDYLGAKNYDATFASGASQHKISTWISLKRQSLILQHL